MASYARINEQNIVEEIIEIDDSFVKDIPTYITSILKLSGTWVRAKAGWGPQHAAQIGHKYMQDIGVFVGPKPFNSWIFSEDYLEWVAPFPYPNDGKDYFWNEDTTSWLLEPQS